MDFIMKLFGIPLGWIMHFIYRFIPNYGIALLVFTILTKLLLFPFAIKQQSSSAKMALIQPQVNEIQKKYAHDRVQMQDEINKLYAEENYNAMSGCLPMLIQMPILFGLIDVIYRPLTHIVRLSKDVLASATRIFTMLGFTPSTVSTIELDIIKAVDSQPLFFGLLGAGSIAAIGTIDYTFFGMNLMVRPEWAMLVPSNFNPVILIPILSGITAFASSLITMKQTAANTEGEQAGAGMMKGMMLTMPIMSLMIAFSVPAGVGLYWVYSNLVGVLQSMYINKFHNPKDMREKLKAEQADRKELERQQRLEVRRKLKAGLLGEENAEKALSQKELDRLRLAAARKRDAEKYGDPVSEEE